MVPLATQPPASRCRPSFFAALLLAALPAAAPLAAQLAAPVLAFETYPGAELLPLAPQGIAALGGRLYFSGRDAAHGAEPWISDGTAARTRRLADLCPGECDGYAAGFTELGGRVVFLGHDGDTGAVYRVEGRTALQVARTGRPTAWARLGSALYFLTDDYRLFRTDGTPGGTAELGSFPCPDWDCRPAGNMKEAGGALYFETTGQLYRLQEGAAPVALAPFYRAGGFTALAADLVVFLGCPEESLYCHLYVTDGTAAGTRRLSGLPEGGFPADLDLELLSFGGRAYFELTLADGSPASRTIGSTDGTDAGTRTENFGADMPALLGVAAHRLVYHGSTAFGRSLMARDAAGTIEILLSGGADFQLIGDFAGGLVYAFGENGVPGGPGFRYLGYTDGTPAGTVTLGELEATPGGATLGGRFYYAGGPDAGNAAVAPGLWRLDGTPGGTTGVFAGAAAPRGAAPVPYRAGNALLFDYYELDGPRISQAFGLDPATLAAAPVADGGRVVAAGSTGVYLVVDPTLSFDGNLHFFDGAELRDLERGGFNGFAAVAADGHFFFFSDVAPGQMLWESDGSAAGTRLLQSFPPGGQSCPLFCNQQGAIAASGRHVFYYAQANGTPTLSRLAVWDRVSRESRVVFEAGGPVLQPLAFPGGRAVFLDHGVGADWQGRRYWASDGTAAGTRPFFEIPAGTNPTRVAVAGDRLFLVLHALDGPQPEQLWVSDLTAAGTRPLFAAASFSQLAAAGDRLFFAADTGAGQEPGFTDGTPGGTRFLDLRRGYEGSRPRHPYALEDGRVVFAADAQGAGAELWISDGTPSTTRRLTDLNPGEAASAPGPFAQVGGRLFFQATDGATGRELWALDLPALPPCPAEKPCRRGPRPPPLTGAGAAIRD